MREHRPSTGSRTGWEWRGAGRGIRVHGGEKGFMCSEEDGVSEGLGKVNCHGDAGSQQLVHKPFNIHAFNQDI